MALPLPNTATQLSCTARIAIHRISMTATITQAPRSEVMLGNRAASKISTAPWAYLLMPLTSTSMTKALSSSVLRMMMPTARL